MDKINKHQEKIAAIKKEMDEVYRPMLQKNSLGMVTLPNLVRDLSNARNSENVFWESTIQEKISDTKKQMAEGKRLSARYDELKLELNKLLTSGPQATSTNMDDLDDEIDPDLPARANFDLPEEASHASN